MYEDGSLNDSNFKEKVTIKTNQKKAYVALPCEHVCV